MEPHFALASIGSVFSGLPDFHLWGFGDLAADIGKAIAQMILWLLRAILTSVLLMFLKVMEPLVYYTPAIQKPVLIGGQWNDVPGGPAQMSDGVIFIPDIAGHAGVIAQFTKISLAIGFSVMAFMLIASFIMIGMGFLPKVKEAGVDNLKKAGLYIVLAIMSGYFFQSIIDLNSVFTSQLLNMSHYADKYESVWQSISQPTSIMDEFSLVIGLLVADLAILVVLLELAVRYGIVIFIPALGPLIMMMLSFQSTKASGQKMMRFFISSVFFQFFVAVGVSIMLSVILAFSHPTSFLQAGDVSVPSWAITAGIATMLAFLPKQISGAGEAVGAATGALKTAVGAAVGVGVGAAAVGAGTAGKAIGGAAKATGTDFGKKLGTKLSAGSATAMKAGTNVATSSTANYKDAIKAEIGMTGQSHSREDDVSTQGKERRDVNGNVITKGPQPAPGGTPSSAAAPGGAGGGATGASAAAPATNGKAPPASPGPISAAKAIKGDLPSNYANMSLAQKGTERLGRGAEGAGAVAMDLAMRGGAKIKSIANGQDRERREARNGFRKDSTNAIMNQGAGLGELKGQAAEAKQNKAQDPALHKAYAPVRQMVSDLEAAGPAAAAGGDAILKAKSPEALNAAHEEARKTGAAQLPAGSKALERHNIAVRQAARSVASAHGYTKGYDSESDSEIFEGHGTSPTLNRAAAQDRARVSEQLAGSQSIKMRDPAIKNEKTRAQAGSVADQQVEQAFTAHAGHNLSELREPVQHLNQDLAKRLNQKVSDVRSLDGALAKSGHGGVGNYMKASSSEKARMMNDVAIQATSDPAAAETLSNHQATAKSLEEASHGAPTPESARTQLAQATNFQASAYGQVEKLAPNEQRYMRIAGYKRPAAEISPAPAAAPAGEGPIVTPPPPPPPQRVSAGPGGEPASPGPAPGPVVVQPTLNAGSSGSSAASAVPRIPADPITAAQAELARETQLLESTRNEVESLHASGPKPSRQSTPAELRAVQAQIEQVRAQRQALEAEHSQIVAKGE